MKFKFWQREGGTPQFFSAEESVVNSSEYTYNQESGVNYEEPQLAQEPTEVKETVYKKASRWIVLIGVALLPVFFLPWSTSVLEFNKQILLLVLAGASLMLWLLHVVVSGQLSWRANPLDKGVAAFLLAVSLSTIFSLARFKSLFGLTGSLSDSLVVVIALSIFYFGIVNLFDDKGDKVRTILGYSLFVVLLYGVLNMFGVYLIRFPFAMSRAFNTVGSVNALGMIAAISLPLLYKTKSTFWGRYINMAGLFLAIALLVVLNWWILWAVAIVGMAMMIALDSLNNPGLKISKFLLPMTVIVLGVFLMVVNFNFSFLKKDLPVEVAPAFGLSTNIAESVLKNNMAFGYGPENFSLAFDQYGAGNLTNTTLSSTKFFDSVSQVFNWAVQGGLVVLVAFAFLLWLLIRNMFKGGLAEEDIGVLSGVAALMVGMFLYPFNLTLMFVTFVMMGLMAVSLWGDEKRLFNVEERASTSLISSLGFIGGLILVLVGTYFGATLYISDVKYAQALSSQDINKAVSLLGEAVNWNGQSDTYYRTASQAALGLLSQELNKKADKADTQQATRVQNYMSSAINFAKTATDLGPHESLNWNNLGNIYQNLLGLVGGVDALSAGAYQKAADLRPGDPSFYNQIGNLYLAESQLLRQAASGNANATQLIQQANASLALAETNFKKAVDMSNNFGLAIYNLGVVYDQEGKLPEAIKQLEKIAPYNSDQPNLLFELGLLYYRNGNKDKAFNTLQQVLVLQSNYSNALWYLALIYEERKDIPNAIIQLQKIIAIDANKDNQAVLTKLDELQNGKKTTPPKKVLDQKPI